MTRAEIKTNIENKLQDLEVHNHGQVKSKSVYEKRKVALNEMIEIIDNALQDYQDESLVQLKNRINLSIRIMELANECGLITEP